MKKFSFWVKCGLEFLCTFFGLRGYFLQENATRERLMVSLLKLGQTTKRSIFYRSTV